MKSESFGKKKIIRVTTIPQSLRELCYGMLNELSNQYDVIGLSSPGEALAELSRREGIRVIAVPMERHISLNQDIKSLWKMWRVFREERPDMVHSMTPKAGMICMVAAWMARVPVRVHTFTGLVFPTSTGFKRRLLMFTDWLTCACATHVIPEGEGVKNDLLNNGITKKPIKVLGYGNVKGVDMNHFSRREGVLGKMKELNLRDESKFTFLFVGRIVRDKGINELVEAFGRIHEQYTDTRLWLVGSFEDKLDPVQPKTREMIDSPDSGIEAVGLKRGDELLAYYAAADCFVLPSYREGFPNTVLEAGAMDLPCIVTDINGSREIIVEGENGAIVPSKSTDALYEAMWRMLNDNEWRESLAGNARRIIAERFEQGYVRRCLYDFYSEVLNS